MKKKLVATLTASGAFLSLSISTAFASTISSEKVTVKHNAYLISAPHTGSNRLALESSGSVLTVEGGSTQYWWHVQDENGKTGYITKNTYYTEQTSTTSSRSSGNVATVGSASATTSTASPSQSNATTHLPPGVTYDPSVNPLATSNATSQQKFNAILQVAQAQLGTPYVWGTSKDRGEDSFDCSNYTAYVYHHALGYKMSGASQTQFHSVGWVVPTANMQPGDLLVFNQGGHVGIYTGNGEMIQCGGGLKKVGYLTVSPGSYWYNHITVVKRMI